MTEVLSPTFSITIQSATGPAWYTAMTDSTWGTIAASGTIDAVKPSPHPGGTLQTNGPIGPWGGATIDTTRQEMVIAAQGGHGDYFGNEVYVLPYNTATPSWQRVTNPRYTNGAEPVMDDGSPRATHGECMSCYAPNADLTLLMSMPFVAPTGNSYKNAFGFSRNTNSWTQKVARAAGWGADAGGDVFGFTGYDPVTGLVYAVMSNTTNGSVQTYNPVTNTNVGLFNGALPQGYDTTGDIAPGKRIMACIGGSQTGNSDVRYTNLDTPGTWTLASTTGTPPNQRGCGFTWHPAGGCFYAWTGGANLFKLTPPTTLPGTWVWSTVTPAGSNTITPTSPNSVGTFSRFKCISNVGGSGRDALILINNTTQATYVYKLPATSSSTFPLSISANSRYLQSPNGTPFFINGDTLWAPEAATRAQADTYLNDRQAKGFTTVLLGAAETAFSPFNPKDLNSEGNRPFSTPNNFATASGAYWGLFDYWINGALSRGMCVMVVPGFYGVDSSQGWINAYGSMSAGQLQTYGAFLANRVSAQGNVIWCLGGDFGFGPAGDLAKLWTGLAAGIRSVNPNAIITMEALRTQSAASIAAGQTGFNLNNIYTNNLEYVDAATEYARSPTRPFVNIEGLYDGEGVATPLICRRQAYASILSGACGHFFGNSPIWGLGEPVANGGGGVANALSTALTTTATTHMTHVKNFFTAVAWHLLQPKTDTSVVTSSLGSGITRVIPARASDGTFAAVYVASAVSPTANMTAITHTPVRIRRFDPTNGSYTTLAGSPFPNTGTQTLTHPGNNAGGNSDWVWILD